jgi:hypothetical protein
MYSEFVKQLLENVFKKSEKGEFHVDGDGFYDIPEKIGKFKRSNLVDRKRGEWEFSYEYDESDGEKSVGIGVSFLDNNKCEITKDLWDYEQDEENPMEELEKNTKWKSLDDVEKILKAINTKYTKTI